MPSLPITSILVGVCALLSVLLSLPVSLRRRKLKVARGDAGDSQLGNLIRAHGNFTEYAPLGLLAVGLVEAGGWDALNVWVVGGLLVGGRLLHAFGMWAGSVPLKALGTLMTHSSFIGSGLMLLASALLQASPGGL
ncbi:MAG: MAPEG family protein [Caulobacteraceae bacterium]|nr:MAPEG family protein [Caulobacteraceae bacterium]